jgi:hypothetical protein
MGYIGHLCVILIIFRHLHKKSPIIGQNHVKWITFCLIFGHIGGVLYKIYGKFRHYEGICLMFYNTIKIISYIDMSLIVYLLIIFSTLLHFTPF